MQSKRHKQIFEDINSLNAFEANELQVSQQENGKAIKRNQPQQTEQDDLMDISHLDTSFTKMKDQLSILVSLLRKHSTVQISQEKIMLYERMLSTIELIKHENEVEIQRVRQSCEEMTERALLNTGEKLLKRNDFIKSQLVQKLSLEAQDIETKIKKHSLINEGHQQQLTKLRFIAAKNYVLLRKHNIIDELKDWKVDNEKIKIVKTVESYQQKINSLDDKISELKHVSIKLESDLDKTIRMNPALVPQIRQLNQNIIDTNDTGGANHGLKHGSTIDFDALVLSIQRGIATIEASQPRKSTQQIKPKSPKILPKRTTLLPKLNATLDSSSTTIKRRLSILKDQAASEPKTHRRISSQVSVKYEPIEEKGKRSIITEDDNTHRKMTPDEAKSRRVSILSTKDEFDARPMDLKGKKSVRMSVDSDSPPASAANASMVILSSRRSTLIPKRHFINEECDSETQSSLNSPLSTSINPFDNLETQDTPVIEEVKYRRQSVKPSTSILSPGTTGMLSQVRSLFQIVPESDQLNLKHQLVDAYQVELDLILKEKEIERKSAIQESRVLKSLWKMKFDALKKFEVQRDVVGMCKVQERVVKIAVGIMKPKTVDKEIQCELVESQKPIVPITRPSKSSSGPPAVFTRKRAPTLPMGAAPPVLFPTTAQPQGPEIVTAEQFKNNTQKGILDGVSTTESKKPHAPVVKHHIKKTSVDLSGRRSSIISEKKSNESLSRINSGEGTRRGSFANASKVSGESEITDVMLKLELLEQEDKF